MISQGCVLGDIQKSATVDSHVISHAGWSQHIDQQSGRVFYLNHATGVGQWEHPVVQEPSQHAADLQQQQRGGKELTGPIRRGSTRQGCVL